VSRVHTGGGTPVARRMRAGVRPARVTWRAENCLFLTSTSSAAGGRVTPHVRPSGRSANTALWAEMRYPVHRRPPTFAEHRDGVIVGVKSGALILPIASRCRYDRVPKSLSVQGFLAEREGFEPSIRVTPDTAFPVRARAVHARPWWSIPNSLAARLTRSRPPESSLVRPSRGHSGGQKTPELAAIPSSCP
jgi:hypothetical protein